MIWVITAALPRIRFHSGRRDINIQDIVAQVVPMPMIRVALFMLEACIAAFNLIATLNHPYVGLLAKEPGEACMVGTPIHNKVKQVPGLKRGIQTVQQDLSISALL